jgi:hypothetical protein
MGVSMTKYGVFFDDDKALSNPIYTSQFMTIAEAWALINESAYEWTGRKLVVKPYSVKAVA